MIRFGLIAALIAWPLAGCGAIFNGTSETIQVQSSPSGTTVTTEPATGTFTTPTAIELRRNSSYVLHFSREGYSDADVQIRQSLSGGILVLDILSGLLGVIIDAATGAWYDLSPDNVSVALERQTAAVEGPEMIRVTVTETESGAWEIRSTEPGVHVGVEAR